MQRGLSPTPDDVGLELDAAHIHPRCSPCGTPERGLGLTHDDAEYLPRVVVDGDRHILDSAQGSGSFMARTSIASD